MALPNPHFTIVLPQNRIDLGCLTLWLPQSLKAPVAR
jgi:hypothetical protein